MTINDLKKETQKLRAEQIKYLLETMTDEEVKEILEFYNNMEQERG